MREIQPDSFLVHLFDVFGVIFAVEGFESVVLAEDCFEMVHLAAGVTQLVVHVQDNVISLIILGSVLSSEVANTNLTSLHLSLPDDAVDGVQDHSTVVLQTSYIQVISPPMWPWILYIFHTVPDHWFVSASFKTCLFDSRNDFFIIFISVVVTDLFPHC